MAVAAAIGVGTDETSNGGMPSSNLSQRLSNKMKMMPNHLGDINRSIEKMTIGSYPVNAAGPAGPVIGPSPVTTNALPVNTQASTRRGSNWTNSTEGYGSMRSEQSMMSSRRCSDVSAMSQSSNISTRAMMNSPWDPMSADSSRRSSMASNHGGSNPVAGNEAQPNIGQHLNRLHRRAQQQTVMTQQSIDGRSPSAMSSMTVTGAPTPTNAPMPSMVAPTMQLNNGQGNHQGGRRASDPVRVLDRHFGVDANMSRRGSYNNHMPQQQQRVPVHGQRIRGMSGDTYFHQQPPMVSDFSTLFFRHHHRLYHLSESWS